MKLSHCLFCIISLASMLLLGMFLFPLAAKSKAEIEFATTPQSAEVFDDIDLGEFGEVPVLDLVDYYLENPPAPETATNLDKKTRFQGC